MPLESVNLSDNFNQWRLKDNAAFDQIDQNTGDIGDLDLLDVTANDLVDAINAVNDSVTRVEQLAAGGSDIEKMIIAIG